MSWNDSSNEVIIYEAKPIIYLKLKGFAENTSRRFSSQCYITVIVEIAISYGNDNQKLKQVLEKTSPLSPRELNIFKHYFVFRWLLFV